MWKVLSQKRKISKFTELWHACAIVHRSWQFLNLSDPEVKNLHEFHPNPEEEDLDLPLFDWLAVASATNDFAFTNKIGEGGFGPVYRVIFLYI